VTRKLRPAPPPLEASDRLVTGVLTGAWAVALIVMVALRPSLPAADRWWLWPCVAGLALGLFALWYVPRLQRSRARAAQRRAAPPRPAEAAGQPDGRPG
jgi:hypothetical protein